MTLTGEEMDLDDQERTSSSASWDQCETRNIDDGRRHVLSAPRTYERRRDRDSRSRIVLGKGGKGKGKNKGKGNSSLDHSGPGSVPCGAEGAATPGGGIQSST